MAGNKVQIEFAGDESGLAKASKQAGDDIDKVGKASDDAGASMGKTSKHSNDLLGNFSKLGNAVSGANDAVGQISDGLDTLNDIQNASYEKSQRQKRALLDVEQAQQDYEQAVRDTKQALEDYNQAQRDASQAGIDSEQALIDQSQAQEDAAKALAQYNQDVKEHGKDSAEAKQDLIDIRQAHLDEKQAIEDGAQAARDAQQATLDQGQALGDVKQSMVDAKGAQLDLNDAQREANPGDFQKWSQDLQTFLPLLSLLATGTYLVTAAQWLWNAAQAASPTTWIILAVAALVAIIVVIATKTTWFQDLWKVTWGGIKAAAKAVADWFTGPFVHGITAAWNAVVNAGKAAWNWLSHVPGWIGAAFSKVAQGVSAPFRWAFNAISDAWNNTIGRLSWQVPGWIPFIGGNTVSVPHLPHFHTGGTVPGGPDQEMLAVLRGGEKVSAPGEGASITIDSAGAQVDDLLVELLARAIRRRGGDVQLVIGGRNARQA